MRKRISLTFALVVVALSAVSAGPAAWSDVTVPTLGTADTAPPAPGDFVTRSGTKLRLNGRPFRFTGLNIYNANSVDNCWYTMAKTRLDGLGVRRSLNRLGEGNEAIRAWFFQSLATTRRRSATGAPSTIRCPSLATTASRWSPRSRTNGTTARAGSRPRLQDRSLVRGGYRTAASSPGRHRDVPDWVAEVVARYKDDPDDPGVAADERGRGQDGRRRGSCASTAPRRR